MAEHSAVNRKAMGSSPLLPVTWGCSSVWESACLTSKTSAVRARLRVLLEGWTVW